MTRKELINRYKIFLAALGVGISMSGCYYVDENGEKQIITKFHSGKSTGYVSNGVVYDPITDTRGFKDYINVRGINTNEYTIVDTNADYITINVKVDKHKIKQGETIIYISKKYDMSISRFIELNPCYSDYKEKSELPKGDKVNIEYDKTMTIPKKYFEFTWEEYIVGPGDNLYGFANADWAIINIAKDDNNLDDNYTVHLNDIIYVPTANSVYGIPEEETTKKIIYGSMSSSVGDVQN